MVYKRSDNINESELYRLFVIGKKSLIEIRKSRARRSGLKDHNQHQQQQPRNSNRVRLAHIVYNVNLKVNINQQ
ncbi:MAG TPA: hypothetical protein VI278_03635 [Nitrososphaeraceae archaeon]